MFLQEIYINGRTIVLLLSKENLLLVTRWYRKAKERKSLKRKVINLSTLHRWSALFHYLSKCWNRKKSADPSAETILKHMIAWKNILKIQPKLFQWHHFPHNRLPKKIPVVCGSFNLVIDDVWCVCVCYSKKCTH